MRRRVLLLLLLLGAQSAAELPWRSLYGADDPLRVELERMAARYDRGPDHVLNHERLLFYRHYYTAGIGNIMQGLLSAFVMALATDRLLVFDWHGTPGIYAKMFQEPFPNFDFQKLLQDGVATEGLVQEWCDVHEHCHLQQLGTMGHFWVAPWTLTTIDVLACANISEVYPQRVVIVDVGAYFGPFLLKSAVHGARIQSLFAGREDAIGSEVSRFLLAPSAFFEGRLQAAQRDLFGANTIGLQIRAQDNNHHDEVDEAHWACVEAHSLDGGEGTVFFVASMHQETRSAISRMSGGRAVWVGQTSEVQKYDSDHILDALQDIFLLARCNATVYSTGSTFGGLAQAIGRRRAWWTGSDRDVCTLSDSSDMVMNLFLGQLGDIKGGCSPDCLQGQRRLRASELQETQLLGQALELEVQLAGPLRLQGLENNGVWGLAADWQAVRKLESGDSNCSQWDRWLGESHTRRRHLSGEVRRREMALAARRLGADVQVEGYWEVWTLILPSLLLVVGVYAWRWRQRRPRRACAA